MTMTASTLTRLPPDHGPGIAPTLILPRPRGREWAGAGRVRAAVALQILGGRG
jgi:hypothetical protein